VLSDSTVEKYATHNNVDGILAEMDVSSEKDRIGFNEDHLSVIWVKYAWGPTHFAETQPPETYRYLQTSYGSL